ncbi:hypothetical protein D9M73_163770 [compost metagenome]
MRGDDHPANHHVSALQFRVEQPQISHQLIAVPGHQVAGVTFQVLAIHVLISALLLDDEHLGAKFQNGIELFFAQVAVMLADPIDCHFLIP